MSFGALSLTHRLLHSAYHLLLGSPQPALMNLRDLAGYLANGGLAPEVVAPRRRCGAAAPCWRWRSTWSPSDLA